MTLCPLPAMRSERDLKRMIAMLELKILQNTLFGYIIRHYAQKVNMFYISALSGETAGKWLRKEKKAASGKEILQQKSIIFCCCDSLPDAAFPDSAIWTAVSVSPGNAQPMSLSAGLGYGFSFPNRLPFRRPAMEPACRIETPARICTRSA